MDLKSAPQQMCENSKNTLQRAIIAGSSYMVLWHAHSLARKWEVFCVHIYIYIWVLCPGCAQFERTRLYPTSPVSASHIYYYTWSLSGTASFTSAWDTIYLAFYLIFSLYFYLPQLRKNNQSIRHVKRSSKSLNARQDPGIFAFLMKHFNDTIALHTNIVRNVWICTS